MEGDQELPLPYEAPEAPQGGDALSQPGTIPGQGQTGATPPATGGQPASDLDNDPRFRAWKSQTDSRLEQVSRAQQQSEIARRAAEMELDRIRTASMDEPSRIVYERNKIANELAQTRNELATVRYNEQLRTDTDEMAARTGVPVAELLKSFTPQDDPHTRWLKALDLQQQRAAGGQTRVQAPNQQAQQQYQNPPQGYTQPTQTYQSPAQNPANRVDTGVGSGQNTTRYQAAYEKALENNDVFAVLDIEAAAQREGVPIRRKTG